MTAYPVDKPASPTIRLTTWTLVGMVAVVITGSYVAETEIVARGRGKIIPVSRVQLVQPQAAGKIVRILASEGQTIKAGDPMVAMDATQVESDIKQIETNISRQVQEAMVARAIITPLARLDPAADGFVGAGQANFRRDKAKDMVDGREALVTAVLTTLRDQIAEVDAELDRTARSQAVQRARLIKSRTESEFVGRKFAVAEKLRKSGTISEAAYLDQFREQQGIANDVLVAERELDELAAAREVLRKRRTSFISNASSTYQKQLDEAETALQGLRAAHYAARSLLADLTIKAPMDGQVEKLSVFTLGRFVEAGTTLMTIIPSNGGIEIEAFFDNRDAGFLASGQKAIVKLDAFPAERFGVVSGQVTRVGADARGDMETGKWVYAVRVKLDRNNIDVSDRELRFMPGMTATIDVVTGKRRLISYFFAPLLRAIQDGFGER